MASFDRAHSGWTVSGEKITPVGTGVAEPEPRSADEQKYLNQHDTTRTPQEQARLQQLYSQQIAQSDVARFATGGSTAVAPSTTIPIQSSANQQQEFLQNLELARQQNQISASSAEELKINYFLQPRQGSASTAQDIIQQYRNLPTEYQDPRNLGYIAGQALNNKIIEDNINRNNQDYARQNEQLLKQHSENYFNNQQQLSATSQQSSAQYQDAIARQFQNLPTTEQEKLRTEVTNQIYPDTYTRAYPKTDEKGNIYFGQQIQERLGESELAYKRNQINFLEYAGKTAELGIAVGVGGLILALTHPRQAATSIKQSAEKFFSNPQEEFYQFGGRVGKNPFYYAGQGAVAYGTGKILGGIYEDFSPIKITSATTGLEEQTSLGDIPSALTRGFAVEVKGKPVFYAGYKPVNSLNPSEFLNPEVFIGRTPPKVNLLPETSSLGESIKKLTQPISSNAQKAILEANLKNIPNVNPNAEPFYNLFQAGGKELEFTQPTYPIKENVLERRTSTPQAVEELYNYEKLNIKQIDKNFGSSQSEAQLTPEARRIAGDTDILLKQKGLSRFIPDIFPLNILKQDAFEFQGVTFVEGIPTAGENLAKERIISETNPMLVEVSRTSPIKEAIGQHAEDVHLNTEDLGYKLPKGKLYGLQAIQKPEIVEGLPRQTLSEQLIVKRGSILTLRRITTPEELEMAQKVGYPNPQKGQAVFLPESHRIKEFGDYTRYLRGLGGKQYAELIESKLPKEIFKEELPPIKSLKPYSELSSSASFGSFFSRVSDSRVSQSRGISSRIPISPISKYSPIQSDSLPFSKSLSQISNPSSSPSFSKPSQLSISNSGSPSPSISLSPIPSSLPSSSSISYSSSKSSSSSVFSGGGMGFNPSGGGFNPSGFLKKLQKGKRKSGYTASLIAEEFNIRTKKSYKELAGRTYSGLEIRPVIARFNKKYKQSMENYFKSKKVSKTGYIAV